MKRARAHSFWRREEGQGLTEFAIVVPIIVMVLLFSVWFAELVTIKLKTQEAARYTAWEVASYKMHDYGKGGSSASKMTSAAMNKAQKEASRRFANLDSTTASGKTRRIFSAAWMKPMIVVTDAQEEAVYGGAIVNFIFNVAAAIVDVISALQFKSGNYVAMALVALGKDWGGARTARMFGSSEWGFNRSGYATATVMTIVQNKWINRGVKWKRKHKGVFMKTPWFITFTESHGVLADTWNLYKGGDVYGGAIRPGLNKGSAYWKQVDRIYFVNKRTRGVAKGIINTWQTVMSIVLGLTMTTSTPPNLRPNDFVQTAMVSKNYNKDGQGEAGMSAITEDVGKKEYDSSPGCGAKGSCPGGDSLKPYGQIMKNRGKWFMGCKREMALGCPSSSASTDNPFGDYVDR